jgi:hypothetical protein
MRSLAQLKEASASKKVSNTPLRLKRQKRFQMLFQEPNSAGSARHVMLWTKASKNLAIVPPLVPTPRAAGMKHLEHNTQSSSVIFVSMAGPPKASHP